MGYMKAITVGQSGPKPIIRHQVVQPSIGLVLPAESRPIVGGKNANQRTDKGATAHRQPHPWRWSLRSGSRNRHFHPTYVHRGAWSSAHCHRRDATQTTFASYFSGHRRGRCVRCRSGNPDCVGRDSHTGSAGLIQQCVPRCGPLRYATSWQSNPLDPNSRLELYRTTRCPLPEGWNNLLTYLYPASSISSRFKPYYFEYFSNDVSVKTLGAALGTLIDTVSADSYTDGFASKRIVIVAHSMGGLVARSFMQEYKLTQAPYTGRPGYSRTAKLITLGTPHTGTPIASWDALNDISTTMASSICRLS